MSRQEIDAVVAGQTVPQQFVHAIEEFGDAIAIRWRKGDDEWGQWTYREYAELVARAAAGLKKLGVNPGDRVVLMLRNVPQFHVLDMAAYFCGATSISIYNSSSPEQISYLVNHCKATVGIVENQGFLKRFEAVRDELTTLKYLGAVAADVAAAAENVFSYDSLIDNDPVDLAESAKLCTPDQLATIIYTSGTTGPPKGVMLTHENVCWTVESLKRSLNFDSYVGKRVMSYLPMAHIAERMVSHYLGAFVGYEVTTCPDPGQIAAYLKYVRPNFIFGVPRVWEKIYSGVNAVLAADPEKQAKFNDGIAAGIPISEAMTNGTLTEEQKEMHAFLDAFAFGPVREQIGLDQCDLAISGAAPIPADILRWFRAIGVPLSEIYGMSESSGPLTFAPYKVKPGSVGPAIPGTEVKLGSDGEVLHRGGNVFLGYLNEPEKTAEVLDVDGWLATGDIGVLDEDGYLRIVDRKKELIITAGGKNISPANLEAALKMVPLIGQACAIGDKRPFVSALVVLDPEGAPMWAKTHGIEFSSLQDLAENAEVKAEIDKGVREVMDAFNNAERVKKVKILGEEWMPDSDLLTPTMKLKRRGIHERYAAEIEALYS